MKKKEILKENEKEIALFLKHTGRQFKKNILLDCLFISLGAGLGAGAALNVCAFLFPVEGAAAMALIIAAVSLLLGAAYALLRFPDRKETARLIDQYGMQERFTTSLELFGKEDIMSLLQKEDARRAAEQFPVRERIPVKIAAGRWITLALLFLSFIIPLFLPSPAKKEAKAGQELKQEVKKEAEKIEKVKEAFKKINTMENQERAALERRLEEALSELKTVESKENLDKAKERFLKKIEQADLSLTEEELAGLKKSLAGEMPSLGKEELEQLAKALSGTEMTDLAELAKLGAKSGSEINGSSGKALELAGEGKAGKEGQEESAQSGDSQNGDGQGGSGQNGDSQGGDSQNGDGQGGDSQNGDGQTGDSQSGDSQNGNSQNGDSQGGDSQNGDGQTGSGQSGDSQSGDSQNGSGQSGDSQTGGSQGGSGQTGGGQGGDSQNGDSQSGSGQGGSGQGGGQNYGSKTGLEKVGTKLENSEKITLSGEAGEDGALSGQKSAGGKSYKAAAENGIAWSGNQVELSRVIGEYKEKAYSSVSRNKVPESMKEVVKAYFDGLD